MLLVFHFLFGVVQQPLSFGIRQRPTLPGVSHPCCIDPGNSHSRAFRSLPAIPDAPPACFLHRRRQAPVPQGAHGEKPSQVQCCTHPETARKQLSPGRFSPCCIAHRARMGKNLAKYNACTRPQTAREQYSVRFQNKKHPISWGVSCFGIRQRPTLPGRLQPSTIGAERLNFCVRYGNRWIPFAIVTGILSRACAVLRPLGFGCVAL